MKKFIDQQPSPHETSAKSPLEKVTTAIAKDNEHHREVMLALHDANILEYEEDIYNQEVLPTIKTDQQEALAEFVQTGDKNAVPLGVLQRYQEERASCEATLTEIAEQEEQPMEKGGYKTEGKIAKILADLGHAALTPNKAAKRVDEMYEATPLGKDVWEQRQIVEDRIGELNAELAYYMGLTEPPLAVVSEETAIRIWGKEAVEEAQSTGDENEPGYIDVFPYDDQTPRSGNKLGYGSRMPPEFIKKDASLRLAEVLIESLGEAWTVQELGDEVYASREVPESLGRYNRVSALLNIDQKPDNRSTIISDELARHDLLLQRGRRYLIDEHGRRRHPMIVFRAVPVEVAGQESVEEQRSGRYGKQQIMWTSHKAAAAAHKAGTTHSEALPAAGSAENKASVSSVPYVDYTLAKRALEAARAAADRQAAEAKERQEALRAAEATLSAEVRVQIEQLVELAQPLIDSLRENSADDNADKQVFPIQDLPEIGSQCASEHDLEIFLNKARQAGLINKKQLRNRALPSAGEALVLILYAYDSQTMYDLVRNDAAKRVLQHKFQQAYENRAVQVVNRREGGASAAQESTTS